MRDTTFFTSDRMNQSQNLQKTVIVAEAKKTGEKEKVYQNPEDKAKIEVIKSAIAQYESLLNLRKNIHEAKLREMDAKIGNYRKETEKLKVSYIIY